MFRTLWSFSWIMPIVVDGMRFDSFLDYLQQETGISKISNFDEFKSLVSLQLSSMDSIIHAKELNTVVFNSLIEHNRIHSQDVMFNKFIEQTLLNDINKLIENDEENKVLHDWCKSHPEIFNFVDKTLKK